MMFIIFFSFSVFLVILKYKIKGMCVENLPAIVEIRIKNGRIRHVDRAPRWIGFWTPRFIISAIFKFIIIIKYTAVSLVRANIACSSNFYYFVLNQYAYLRRILEYKFGPNSAYSYYSFVIYCFDVVMVCNAWKGLKGNVSAVRRACSYCTPKILIIDQNKMTYKAPQTENAPVNPINL